MHSPPISAQIPAPTDQVRSASEAGPAGKQAPENASRGDTVEISDQGREKAEAMRTGVADQTTDSERTTLSMGARPARQPGETDKEGAVEELQDTDSDIKKKTDELESARRSSLGSEDERAAEVKKLERELRELRDTKKELQSDLAS